jgi:hypothetical protein
MGHYHCRVDIPPEYGGEYAIYFMNYKDAQAFCRYNEVPLEFISEIDKHMSKFRPDESQRVD